MSLTDQIKALVVRETTEFKSVRTALTGKSAVGHNHPSTDINDSTAVGRSLVVASTPLAARTAIGAGTSSLVIGTAAGTAKDGAYAPASTDISDSTAIGRALVVAVDATTARSAIGAGTSSLVLGSSGTTAAAGDHVHAYSSLTSIPSTFAPIIGSGAAQAVAGNDARLTDARTPLTHVHAQSDITGLAASLAAKADLVGGLVPTSQMPPLALTTAVPVASQAAMLALTTGQVQPGDLAIRSDGAGTFILMAADPSVLGNWTLLNTPTNVVTSVNAMTGAVVLGKADVGLGNADNTSDITKNAAVATLTNKTLTSPVINTPTGIVKGDVGLGNTDNTSDTTKNAAAVALTNKDLTSGTNTFPTLNQSTTGNAATATKLTTARNINGVAFDGTGNITVADSTKEPTITVGSGTQYWRGDKVWSTLNAASVGLGNVDNTSDVTKNAAAVTLTNKTLTSPVVNTPTGIVKGDVGLGNVDNTSDVNKPVSTAQAAADATKEPSIAVGTTGQYWRGDKSWQTLPAGGGDALTTNPLSQFAATTSLQLKGVLSDETGSGALVFGTSPALVTPTGIVKGDVGLGNVDNTSDATKQTANDARYVPLDPRVNTVASSATPAINTDTTDLFTITALAAAITSMTTNLTGTPVNGQKLMIRIKDNATARAITWGASFVASGASALPTTTTISKTHTVSFIYDSVAVKWVCMAADLVGY